MGHTGTPFDFRVPKKLSSHLKDVPGGFDHNYVLGTHGGYVLSGEDARDDVDEWAPWNCVFQSLEEFANCHWYMQLYGLSIGVGYSLKHILCHVWEVHLDTLSMALTLRCFCLQFIRQRSALLQQSHPSKSFLFVLADKSAVSMIGFRDCPFLIGTVVVSIHQEGASRNQQQTVAASASSGHDS